MFLGSDLHARSQKSSPNGSMTPYFVGYAAQVKSQYPDLGVFTSGGFRCREDIELAVSSGQCDAVGVVRPAAVRPDLARTILATERVGNADDGFGAPRVEPPWLIKQVGVTALNVHMDNVGFCPCPYHSHGLIVLSSRPGIWSM
jgi:tRNA-dihydrouridine synthase